MLFAAFLDAIGIRRLTNNRCEFVSAKRRKIDSTRGQQREIQREQTRLIRRHPSHLHLDDEDNCIANYSIVVRSLWCRKRIPVASQKQSAYVSI